MVLRFVAVCLLALPACVFAQPQSTNQSLIEVGEFKRIYDPSIGEKEPWYINDHCFIYDHTGRCNLFGITREEPARPAEEDNFAHATATNLTTKQWDKQPFALTVDSKGGEAHLWAPHVIEHEGLYYMYYCAGGKGSAEYQIKLATSKDMSKWERHPANPMLIDGFDARDPFILRHGDKWLMYYTATTKPQGGNHTVFVVESKDLVHWDKNKKTAFLDPEIGTFGGPTESPFVVRRGKTFYLFIGPRDDYSRTCVYRSNDPYEFKIENMVGSIKSRAAEVIRDVDGKWYVSRAGWGQGGVYLAPMKWTDVADENDTSMPVPKPKCKTTAILSGMR